MTNIKNLKDERIGLINYNKSGYLMKIIEYNSSKDLTVEFEDGSRNKGYWHTFKKGEIGKPKKDRTGEENINNQGCKMIITKYNNCYDSEIFFPEYNYYLKNVSYHLFKKGSVFNPLFKNKYGGYIGEGYIYTAKEKPYNVWIRMLERAYSDDYHIKEPTYIGCSVCEDWMCYSTFEKWFIDNYYELDGEKVCLDKDILVKGNKIYSPEMCIFVPQKINNLFTKNNKIRGKYPLGVYWHKKEKKFNASLNINGNQIVVGRFDTPEEAFECYKEAKENEIKRIANEYKNKIPQILYEAMMNYQVEITD